REALWKDQIDKTRTRGTRALRCGRVHRFHVPRNASYDSYGFCHQLDVPRKAIRKTIAPQRQIRQGHRMNAKPFITLPSVLILMLSVVMPAVTSFAAETAKPIRALLVTGGCCHDYTHQKTILTEGISARAKVEWTIVHEGDGTTTHRVSIYEKPDWSKGFDVVVHDECFADVKDKEFVENILKPLRAGLPAVNLH